MKKYWNRYTRNGLKIVIGLLLSFIAYTFNQNMIADQVHTQRIIVAKVDIAPFEELTKDKLEYKDVVVSAVPTDAVLDADDIHFSDAFASNYGFTQGMAIRQGYITSAAESALGSVVGLKEGMRQIGVKTDLVMSAGGEVKSGILVDAYAFVKDGLTGQDTMVISPDLVNLSVVKQLNSEGSIPDPDAGNSQIPAVVVLEVTPEQAAELMVYQETGKVYLLPAGTEPPIQ